MADLTRHEESILVAVLHLRNDAYGVNIRRRIRETTGKSLNYGTLYRLLDQLVRKHLLERHEGKPLPAQGGRRKNYYRLTEFGIGALREAAAVQQSLWNAATRAALEKLS